VASGLSPRRITLSTSGLVPEIAELARLPARPLLALSLNATTDEVRRELMPIGRRYSLSDLKQALEGYPLRPRERLTIEYVLLEGVNDSLADATASGRLLRGISPQYQPDSLQRARAAPFRAPSDAQVDAFARALLARRPSLLTVRRSRGRDVQAACGQLVQS
jgi:23S rRNA (adenine2503-C2)-methyltransferase